ncbi:facilitator of iron transport 1-like [Histomonas meleagridis]|uniref:facilitator of iron transport 1-like n=1 Tax=Histomonas meleagridis TaxID=135588 RepID=UPI00355977A3|nr:facilitator of iron transport 1-like [Histomonas meleagridis]KAH0799422.1 facilitator of iron transport 1-like [Histomonas meleagridis]
MLFLLISTCLSITTITWDELENRTPQEVCSKYNTLHVRTATTCHIPSEDECGVGTQTEEDKKDALNYMNFYRYACGLGELVQSTDAEVIQEQMEACTIMEANDLFSHYLDDTSLACWTSGGQSGARNSNIFWSSGAACGSRSIDSYMDDSDVESCGHRRWLLLPTLSQLAQGVNGHYSATRVMSFDRTGTSSPKFIAYPPPGAFPVNLIPNVWTFSRQWDPSSTTAHNMPSDSQVSLTYDDQTITCTIEIDTENTAMYSGAVKFQPATKPTAGQTVKVVITSVSLDTEWRYSFVASDCSSIVIEPSTEEVESSTQAESSTVAETSTEEVESSTEEVESSTEEVESSTQVESSTEEVESSTVAETSTEEVESSTQVESSTEEVESSTEEVESSTVAETSTEEAESSSEVVETSTEEVESSTQVESSTEVVESSSEVVETSTEEAESSSEEVESSTQVETSTEEAESSSEEVESSTQVESSTEEYESSTVIEPTPVESSSEAVESSTQVEPSTEVIETPTEEETTSQTEPSSEIVEPTSTPEPTPSPQPTPVSDEHLDIYYRSAQGNESDSTTVYLSTFQNFTLSSYPTVKSVTVHIGAHMTSNDYLKLEGLRNATDITYVSLTTTRYDCYIDINSLITTTTNIKKLKFDTVNVNLINYETITTTTKLNIESLHLIESTIANYEQFKHLDMTQLKEIEYSNYEMLLRFEELNQQTISNITFTDEITEVILTNNNISFITKGQQSSESITKQREQIHIKSKTSFTLDISNINQIDTILQLELVSKDQRISIPANPMPENLPIEIIVNENGLSLDIPNTNIIPFNITGHGQISLLDSFISHTFTKQISAFGDISFRLHDGIKDVKINQLNMNDVSSVSLADPILLSDTETQNIEITELNIPTNVIATISDSIIKTMNMNNGYVILKNSITFNDKITIEYGNNENDYTQSLMQLNDVSSFNYNATEFVMSRKGENLPDNILIMAASSSSAFTIDKCNDVKATMRDDDGELNMFNRYSFECKQENDQISLNAKKNIGYLYIAVIPAAAVLVIIIIVIIVVVAVKKKNKAKPSSKDNSNDNVAKDLFYL